jgi:hypothetical protein
MTETMKIPLDSYPKGLGTIVSDDDEEATGLNLSPPLKHSKRGQPLAQSGRPSFSANKVNKRFNSRYQNSANTNTLGGKLLELGRATGICALPLFGFEVSLEAASTIENERIFR